MSASAFSLSMAIPPQGFEVTAGEPVLGGLHGDTQHYFCPYCKSWLFTRPAGDLAQQFVNVRATMLEDASWFVPFAETCTSEGLPSVSTGAAHSYPNLPAMDVYPTLVAEFAEKGARPR